MKPKKILIKGWKKIVFRLLIAGSCLSFFFPGPTRLFGSDMKPGTSAQESRKWKILHIMSYHSPWQWTDDMFNGFKVGLNGLDIEYRVFQMDSKHKSTDEWKQEAARKARDLTDNWKPNLVYTTDDNAQKYKALHRQ
jgi:hypothetical protein